MKVQYVVTIVSDYFCKILFPNFITVHCILIIIAYMPITASF